MLTRKYETRTQKTPRKPLDQTFKSKTSRESWNKGKNVKKKLSDKLNFFISPSTPPQLTLKDFRWCKGSTIYKHYFSTCSIYGHSKRLLFSTLVLFLKKLACFVRQLLQSELWSECTAVPNIFAFTRQAR